MRQIVGLLVIALFYFNNSNTMEKDKPLVLPKGQSDIAPLRKAIFLMSGETVTLRKEEFPTKRSPRGKNDILAREENQALQKFLSQNGFPKDSNEQLMQRLACLKVGGNKCLKNSHDDSSGSDSRESSRQPSPEHPLNDDSENT